MGGLKIVEYSKRDFRSIANDNSFWEKTNLPISRRRCIAQSLNPRADEDDILLIAAYSDDALVSYIGILPDIVVNDDKSSVKFGWLTTWWTDKNSEHRLAATVLLFSAIKRYSGRVAISAFTLDAKRVYDASRRFSECARFQPVYFIMALPVRFVALGTATKLLSRLKNKILFAFNRRASRLDIETVNASDQGVQAFLNDSLPSDPFRRDLTYWRWVWDHPWISASGEDKSQQERYQFSVSSDCFEQIPVVVRRDGEIIGLLFMKLRDDRLSLMFALYEPRDTQDIAEALKIVIIKVNPWVYVSVDEGLNAAFKRGRRFFLTALQREPVLAYASFPLHLGARPQYSLGDNIFT